MRNPDVTDVDLRRTDRIVSYGDIPAEPFPDNRPPSQPFGTARDGIHPPGPLPLFVRDLSAKNFGVGRHCAYFKP